MRPTRCSNSGLLVICCSSKSFRRLYTHHQEVRLQLLWCWRVGWQDVCTARRKLLEFLLTMHKSCHPTLQHHNSYNRTGNQRLWNAVWPPDDGCKDARNMLRNNCLPIKSLFVASSWSRIYLLRKWYFARKSILLYFTMRRQLHKSQDS